VPSTVIERPAGTVVTVTEMLFGVKFAVSEIGPFIVTDDALRPPVYDPAPMPVQLANENPVPADAEIGTDWPALNQLLAGSAVPPAPAAIVR
jgi:hypothetical protein